MARRGGPSGLAIKKAAIWIGLRSVEQGGIRALSLREIARQLGYTAGYLEAVFGSKDAFLEEVLTQSWAECYRCIYQAGRLDRENWRERILLFIQLLNDRPGMRMAICYPIESKITDYHRQRLMLWTLLVHGDKHHENVVWDNHVRSIAAVFIGSMQVQIGHEGSKIWSVSDLWHDIEAIMS